MVSRPSTALDASENSMTKKRKLRHPRTARACDFCRRRKTRCSGELPSCALCIEHDVICSYNEEPPPRRRSTLESNSKPIPTFGSSTVSLLGTPHNAKFAISQPVASSPEPAAASVSASRRASLEPEATFDNGLHVGPTSGVSFLYKWQDPSGETPVEKRKASALSSYGDVPLPHVPKANLPDLEEGKRLVEHYFRFAMPTFRFFHQQTLERWMDDFVSRKPLEPIRAASVLIVWAHSLMYSEKAPSSTFHIPERCLSYLEQARALMSNEAGPAQIASIEARVATCFVLLSISHINECRFLLGSTYTLVIILGLHRKPPKRHKMSLLESERRKRVFWSFYAIDGYLSVMLGQPRQLRDEDIDQEYPENVEDVVLDTATDLAQCPRHGPLEASISHSKLARLFAQSNDLLYPIVQLSTEEILHRSERMVDALDELERGLPEFLKPRVSAATGTQTWDRQNTVLALASAHARIIASRRSILVDRDAVSLDAEARQRLQTCIRVCLQAICDILDRVSPMLHNGRLLWCFWLTHYVTTCAISTLLVFKIQRVRGRIYSDTSLDQFSEYYMKAQEVQKHLTAFAPEGSQAQRHYLLLDRLKRQADRAQVDSTSAERATVANTNSNITSKQLDPLESTGTGAPAIWFGDHDSTSHNTFDLAFEDASSWQYLDQLGSSSTDLDSSLLWSYD